VCGSGAVVCSLSLLIRGAQRARCQAEIPLIDLSKIPEPALTVCPVYARLVGYDAAGVPVADSRDIQIFNWAEKSPISVEVSISDNAARIRSATLFVGAGTFANNWGYPVRAQIDSLSATSPDNDPGAIPSPAAPIITVSAPLPGEVFSYPFPISLRGQINAPGGIFTFCTRINNSVVPPREACDEGRHVQPDNSFNVPIANTDVQPGVNTLYAFVYDLWGRTATAAVSIRLATPPPPIINIAAPSPGQSFSSPADVRLTGNVVAPGQAIAFCIQVNKSAVPALTDCNQFGLIKQAGFFIGATVNAIELQPGTNTIHLFAFDRWQQVGTAHVAVILPSDLRITGMEVTQGIQRESLPLNIGGPRPYAGVSLIAGGKTIVRVFANQVAGGPVGGVSARLYGTTPHPRWGVEPLGLVLPDNGNLDLKVYALVEVRPEERADPNGAFVFTLPYDWTTRGEITLRAVINPSDYYKALEECAGCQANNTMILTNIPFKPRAPITLSPVQIIWSDNVKEHRPSDDSSQVFRQTASISPLSGGGLIVQPYIGQIDVSDLFALQLDKRDRTERIVSRLRRLDLCG
jgi:hypothetical protein